MAFWGGTNYKYFASQVKIDKKSRERLYPIAKLKEVFNPGFTTKKRGWGLGLALAKRIIENYHNGKIFVFSTEIDHGTTFRIVLNRNKSNKSQI